MQLKFRKNTQRFGQGALLKVGARTEIELMQALCIYNRYIECYSVVWSLLRACKNLFPENLVYEKYYYISSWNYPYFDLGRGGGVILSICVNNRKSNKIMHCVDLFFWVTVFKIWAFFTFLSIYLLWIDITPPSINTKLKY